MRGTSGGEDVPQHRRSLSSALLRTGAKLREVATRVAEGLLAPWLAAQRVVVGRRNLSCRYPVAADSSKRFIRGADRRAADLSQAHLREADLCRAYLCRAKPSGANLCGARLRGAKLDGATLPDGSEWTPETDMARFTDLTHPDFWCSDDVY